MLCVATPLVLGDSAASAGAPESAAQAPGGARPTPGLLFVDTTRAPTATISWTTMAGERREFSDVFAYAVDADRRAIGGNLTCFAAVGGTRIGKGAGHPQGSVVRVGFYKADPGKPMFDGVGPGTEITVTLHGVRFNQPVDAYAASVIQHLKYDRGEMQACGIPGDAREQFNTADPLDTLNNRTRPGVDALLGTLDGSEDALGTARLTVDDEHTATMEVTFQYRALRNLRDPWKSDLPGTFLEPIHFHLEFEALPEGVPPFDHRSRTVPPHAD